MPAPADLGFALVHPTLTSREYVIVRVTKRGKRFTEVETLHADPANRKHWRETSRGLWDFPTQEAADRELDALFQSGREYAALRRASEQAQS